MRFTKIILLVLILGVVYDRIQDKNFTVPSFPSPSSHKSNSAISQAYANQQSDIQVRGTGKVSRILRDDNEGSRHQKFILRLSTGQTILISHNIDLADRIDGLREGDEVSFNGEYEWNDRGGVVHWTHHDPAGRHEGGWLEHDGISYQ
ncbi:MAG: DUF3465 domain-containing protein [Pseudomonadales bacterium]